MQNAASHFLVTRNGFGYKKPIFFIIMHVLIKKVKVKVKVSHSLIAVGAVGVRVPLYLGHS